MPYGIILLMAAYLDPSPSGGRPTSLDFKAIFESVPGSYLILTPNFTIVAVSNAYLAATNTVREKILGKALFEVFPDNPDDPHATGVKNLTASLNAVLHTKAPDTMAVQKYDIKRPKLLGGGFEVRYWSPLNSPVLTKGGEVELIIHSVVDVTQFVKLQEIEAKQTRIAQQLKEQNRLFQAQVEQNAQEAQQRQKNDQDRRELEKLRSDFFTIASHQLRTPLTAIKWSAEGLISPTADMSDPKKLQYLQQIHASNERMIGLVNTLLDVSRLDFGALATKPEKVALPELLEEILKNLTDLMRSKNITVSKIIDKKLVAISIDPSWMRLMFQNLLSNAILYSHDGGEVTIVLDQEPSDVLIEVRDTGYGIPKDQQDKIFSKLFRADNAQRLESDGSGLGLYLVKAIVERAGGQIWFDSVENRGSTFYVKLPVNK